jgi:hypothetical protein
MVAELLVPVDDEKNEHKQKQLRELVSLKQSCVKWNIVISIISSCYRHLLMEHSVKMSTALYVVRKVIDILSVLKDQRHFKLLESSVLFVGINLTPPVIVLSKR